MVSVVKDVKNLLNAAYTPQLWRHFEATFAVTTLDPVGPSTNLLPSKIKAWEEVAFQAVEEMNKGKIERREVENGALTSQPGQSGCAKAHSPLLHSIVPGKAFCQ